MWAQECVRACVCMYVEAFFFAAYSTHPTTSAELSANLSHVYVRAREIYGEPFLDGHHGEYVHGVHKLK